MLSPDDVFIVGKHNQVIRNNIDMYKGYEVSFELHSFTVAFTSVEDAVNFAIAVQISLLHVDWPVALLQQNMYAFVHYTCYKIIIHY